ncbi:hypothetical protein [Alterisphingorhabdus coralli]|uniref:Phage holin family protein n=1 Tax=Alterisphingorhabdus coralli TaxID=3071408 RepID=A0AA97F4X5_9SPHN|nr:hypothetical protein [Parasphingorhabdus sp. SCSIO 66989]WOE74086.1 hypothetical protein RB602_09475 [Parasphingorhabdus sp. SCSIO 66989]
MSSSPQTPQDTAPDDTHHQDTHDAAHDNTVPGENADVNTEDAPTRDQTADKPAMVDQLKGLYADGQTWFQAELGFQKGRINYTVRAAKLGAIGVGVGLFTLLCAYITLLLGIFMTVAHYFGPLIALLTVPLTWTVLGLLALRFAKSQLNSTKAMIAETGGITGRKVAEAVKDDNG